MKRAILSTLILPFVIVMNGCMTISHPQDESRPNIATTGEVPKSGEVVWVYSYGRLGAGDVVPEIVVWRYCADNAEPRALKMTTGLFHGLETAGMYVVGPEIIGHDTQPMEYGGGVSFYQIKFKYGDMVIHYGVSGDSPKSGEIVLVDSVSIAESAKGPANQVVVWRQATKADGNEFRTAIALTGTFPGLEGKGYYLVGKNPELPNLIRFYKIEY